MLKCPYVSHFLFLQCKENKLFWLEGCVWVFEISHDSLPFNAIRFIYSEGRSIGQLIILLLHPIWISWILITAEGKKRAFWVTTCCYHTQLKDKVLLDWSFCFSEIPVDLLPLLLRLSLKHLILIGQLQYTALKYYNSMINRQNKNGIVILLCVIIRLQWLWLY